VDLSTRPFKMFVVNEYKLTISKYTQKHCVESETLVERGIEMRSESRTAYKGGNRESSNVQ
jgi:hypothetical protein